MKSIAVQDSKRYSAAQLGSRKSRQKRSAFSLVELLVVITIITSLMFVTGGTFALLMRSEKSVTQSLLLERTISRLAEQFRKDVHEATLSDQTDPNTEELDELALSDAVDESIRYRVSKNGVERQRIKQKSIIARDAFLLPDCQVSFRQGTGTESTMRSIVLLRPGALMQRTPHAPIPRRRLEIDAFINPRTQVTVHKMPDDAKPSEEAPR